MTKLIIPADAPFSEQQKTWLDGFMAGINTRLLEAADAGTATGVLSLDILLGTQTGNAEMVCEDLAASAGGNGLQATIHALDDVELEALASMERVLVVTSTYGEGEMPDNAHVFWETLQGQTPDLSKVNFAVLGLGDTSYDGFCQAAKDIDTRFAELGGNRVKDGVWLDVDFEDGAEEWASEILPHIKTFGDQEAASANAPTSGGAAKEKSKWNRKNPYHSAVAVNRRLSGEKSAKEIRHYEFALGDSGITYAAGDALAVQPINNSQLVDGILDTLGIDAGANVGGEPIHSVLMNQYEIMTPSKDLVCAIAAKSDDDEFQRVVSNDDKEQLENFLWTKDSLDLLQAYDKAKFSAEEFMALLRPLQHRAYSISSSPKEHADHIHLTIGTVRWNAFDRLHGGVASTFLADRVADGGKSGVFLSENKAFRPPQDFDAPMIMVGPGTGIAPFRAFLQDRRADEAKGKNWLFFGDQHAADDYIYQDEISQFEADGYLHKLDLAFSRDQAEKIYVQTRMKENGSELYAWLEEGGYFYVCGDATRMAKDVDTALHEVIAEHGGLDADGAKDYVNQMKKEKRYLRDVY